MERTTSIKEAKEIFGSNFIGPEELVSISKTMGINVPLVNPGIPFDIEYLRDKGSDYLLILGVCELDDDEFLTINSLRKKFGTNPDEAEPCFYNQDWYSEENFANRELENKWFLIKKNIFDDSRAASPKLLSEKYAFPSAILCVYTFFVFWHWQSEILWPNEFIWCDDIDHNGDAIYVGRYYDSKGINKNGFNIHRHLSIGNNYGSIEIL